MYKINCQEKVTDLYGAPLMLGNEKKNPATVGYVIAETICTFTGEGATFEKKVALGKLARLCMREKEVKLDDEDWIIIKKLIQLSLNPVFCSCIDENVRRMENAAQTPN